MAADQMRLERDRLRSPARFVGSWVNKIDVKGRVSVPADLRRHIDPGAEEPSPVVYAFPWILEPEILCGGDDLVDTLLKIVRTDDVFAKRRAMLERGITAFTERLYFDDNGRISVPKKLRDHARIEGQAAFAGRGAFFSLAAPAPEEDLWAEMTRFDEGERDVLRGRSLPSILSGEAGE